MKTNINMIKTAFGAFLFCIFLVGCSEDIMDKINEDRDHTSNVDAKFILADVITSTAFSNVGGDFNSYVSTYIEYEVGVDNQFYNAETRLNEPTAASTFNNPWRGVYSTLKNARIAINQCREGGRDEGNYVTKGIAEVLAAYNSALLTDMFGDAPFSEAAIVDKYGSPVYMTPKIDKQEEIYKEVIRYLDDAIEDLQKTDRSPISSYDLMYKGSAGKWLKLAYGLKARYTMRLVKHSADLDKVLDYVSKSFSSVGEQAEFAVYDVNNINPLYGLFIARAPFASSESLGEKLAERKDPRLKRAILSPEDDGVRTQITSIKDANYVPAPNGNPEQSQQKYSTSVFMFAKTAPTIVMSYHELKFIEAEALCRLNRMSDAEIALNKAVVSGIMNAERSVQSAIEASEDKIETTSESITTEDAQTYFDTQVKPLFTSNPFKETMIQKYISFWGASGEATECYNDIRRMKALGENFVELKNTNKFPLRLPYGDSDTTANPEVKAAYGDGQYVYTEPVWWAGGSR